jgi:hypothetical protein
MAGTARDTVTDDVTDDATDDVQDDVTDDATEDDTSDATEDDATGDAADDATDDKKDSGQGGKPRKSAAKSQQSKTDDDDPNAGLKKALASERVARRAADKELKELRLKHASAEERQLIEAKETAAAEAEARVKAPLIKALAASELRAAGVQQGTAKLVGLLDLAKVELDDEGELVGLDEQIEEMKEEFPNLFAAATGTRVPNVNGGSGNGRRKDKDGGDQKPKGFAQQLADQVMGAAPPGQGMVLR